MNESGWKDGSDLKNESENVNEKEKGRESVNCKLYRLLLETWLVVLCIFPIEFYSSVSRKYCM